MLYGLYRNPPLDIVATWSEAYKTSLPANTHKANSDFSYLNYLIDGSSYGWYIDNVLFVLYVTGMDILFQCRIRNKYFI